MLQNYIYMVSIGELTSIQKLVRPRLHFQHRIHEVVTCRSFWFDLVSSFLHKIMSKLSEFLYHNLNATRISETILRFHLCFVLLGIQRDIFQLILFSWRWTNNKPKISILLYSSWLLKVTPLQFRDGKSVK